MKCSDLDTTAILEFLAEYRGQWCTWQVPSAYMPSVGALFPDADDRLVRRKMANLIRKGYVSGCTCGCRGDYEITEKGTVYLEEKKNDVGAWREARRALE